MYEFLTLLLVLVIAFGVPLLLLFRHRWSKGELGELKVNKGLRRFLDQEVYHLVENITLPAGDGTTQIDHIVISPYGVFVIETKNMKGWIFGDPNRAQWTQQIYRHKNKFQNPIRQNYKHVAAVQELLSLGAHQVHSVTVFVGDCTFKTPMPAKVVNGVTDLAKYIKSKDVPFLDECDLPSLVDSLLKHRLPPGSTTDLTHIKNIKKQMLVCPQCGSKMVERANQSTGDRFLGCKRYPECKGTRPFP